jgi:pterin-4a-carbinolamine dehydratase
MSQQWQERKRPLRLERRYEFENYDSLRDFLDRAAELSEREDYYPDMGFGRDYLNVTIHAEEGATELSDNQRHFAQQLDALLSD